MQDELPVLITLTVLVFLLVASMALKQRQRNLHEYLPNEVLVDLVTSLLALMDELCKIPAFAILHDYI